MFRTPAAPKPAHFDRRLSLRLDQLVIDLEDSATPAYRRFLLRIDKRHLEMIAAGWPMDRLGVRR